MSNEGVNHGFKVGDSVRLKIVQIPSDHKAVIKKIKHEEVTEEMVFFVLLTSEETPEANGVWGPVWLDELEKVGA